MIKFHAQAMFSCIGYKIILHNLTSQNNFRLDVPKSYKFLISGRKAIVFMHERNIFDLFFRQLV